MKNLPVVVAVLVVALTLATTPIRSERDDHKCGRCYDCTSCSLGRCCSVWGYCGDSFMHCGNSSVCASQCPFDANLACHTSKCYPDQAESNSNIYGWDSKGSRVRCASHLANISLHANRDSDHLNPFCPKQGDSNITNIDHACGHCLKVTKRKTGAQTMVPLSTGEECSNEHHDSDLRNKIFKELDTDGEGNAQGYLTVDYRVVHCYDDDEP